MSTLALTPLHLHLHLQEYPLVAPCCLQAGLPMSLQVASSTFSTQSLASQHGIGNAWLHSFIHAHVPPASQTAKASLITLLSPPMYVVAALLLMIMWQVSTLVAYPLQVQQGLVPQAWWMLLQGLVAWQLAAVVVPCNSSISRLPRARP